MSVGSFCVFLIIKFLAFGAFGKETLRLGVLISTEGDSQDGRIDNSGYLSTLYYALQTVNDDSSLKYGFTVALNNSQVR